MAAITWRNVNGPSLAEASGIMSAAGDSFNAGFGTLDKMLKQREAVQASNWEAGKVNNTQDIMDVVAAAKTPEEVAALEASGRVKQMQDGFHGQVNRDQLRGALSAQLATTRQQETAGIAYADAARARAEDPINEELRGYIAAGDKESFNRRLAEVNIRGEDKHVVAANAAWKQRQLDADAEKLRPGKLANQEQQVINDGVALRDQAILNQDTKRADALLEVAAKERAAANAGRVTAATNLAKTLGIKVPVDASGMPDITQMSEEQVSRYGKAFKAGGLNKDTSSSASIAAYDKAMTAAGVPLAVRKVKLAEAANTFNDAALSGEDATKLAAKNLRVTQQVELDKAHNLAYTPPKEALKLQTTILNAIDSQVTDSQGTRDRIRTKVSDWMTNGIEINGVKMKVPPRVVEYAMAAGVEKDVYFFQQNETTENMERIITEFMASDNYKAMEERAGYLESGGDQVELFNNTIQARKAAGINTNEDYSASLENSVKIADDKAAKTAATKAAEAEAAKKLATQRIRNSSNKAVWEARGVEDPKVAAKRSIWEARGAR